MEVLVLARYHAQKGDELSLAPGDVVQKVCEGPARGWLRGELGGRRGLFPKRLVQEIPEALRSTEEARRPRCARAKNAPSGHPAKFPGLQRWCKVNFNYRPEQEDELTLQTGEIVEVIKEIEDGWWLGKKNGQLGAFPSNFVELLDSGSPSFGNSEMPSISPDSQRPPKLTNLTYDSPPDYLRTVSCPETCRVLFDYQPEAPDELALRKGDLVKVLRKTTEDKGWWEGECQGRRGVFPDNFVLLPPPVKRLVPRKVVSQESAPIKEPKHLKHKTSLPNVKKLPTATPKPSKDKISSTPSGDGKRRPFRDTGSNGKFLNGGPRQPGRKRSQTQAPRRHSVSSKEQEQSNLVKTPTLNKTTTPEKTSLPDKAPSPEKIAAPDKVPTPEKTSLPDKAPSPEKIAAPDKVPTPEKTQTLDDLAPTTESPTSETLVDSNKIPTTKTTVDKASSPERGFSHGGGPALEAPPKDETLDPNMAPQEDKAPIPVTVLTPEQMLSEEDRPRNKAQLEHFSQEETPQRAKCPVVSGAQSQKEIHRLEESPQLCNFPEGCPCMAKLRNRALRLQSKSEPGCRPALGKTCHQPEAIPLTEETCAKDECTPQQEAPLTEETPPKEVPPKDQIPPEGEVASKTQVPPKEAAPTPQSPQTALEMTPEPQETPTPHSLYPPNASENKNDQVEMTTLKEEVGSLKRALELLELQVEERMAGVWEELKNERERRQLLEVQMQRTPKTWSMGSKHAETQTL